MSKLDPIPKPKYSEKKGWNDLNEWLQRSFPENRRTKSKLIQVLNYNDYEMDVNEMKIEIEKLGLKATINSPDYLRVEE